MEVVIWVNVISIAIGFAGFILGIVNFFDGKFSVEKELFDLGCSTRMVNARHFVRIEQSLTMKNKEVPQIINFYNYWGLMVKRKHLSLNIFNSSSGTNVIEMYRKTYELINEERCKRSPLYGKDFEWLYNKVLKKYPDVAKLIDSKGNPINNSESST